MKLTLEEIRNKLGLKPFEEFEKIIRSLGFKSRTGKTTRLLLKATVAVLHDVIKDADYSLNHLVAAGFSEEIVQAVEALTKQEGESYKNYLRLTKTNPIAFAVNLADLQDNMDLTRLPTITEKDIERQKKYSKAVVILENNEQV